MNNIKYHICDKICKSSNLVKITDYRSMFIYIYNCIKKFETNYYRIVQLINLIQGPKEGGKNAPYMKSFLTFFQRILRKWFIGIQLSINISTICIIYMFNVTYIHNRLKLIIGRNKILFEMKNFYYGNALFVKNY